MIDKRLAFWPTENPCKLIRKYKDSREITG